MEGMGKPFLVAQVSDLQAQVKKSQETGGAVLDTVKGAVSALSAQLAGTPEDLAAAQQKIDDANQRITQAEEDASSASSAVDKAEAEAERLGGQASIAGDCAKAYVGAFKSLFEGDNIRTQAPKVRDQLQGITSDCQTALGGT